MLLEKITIKDWRCFYGETQIEFASKTDKNVTLIHAENGVGKTSLLNALLWCFYSKTTPRFEKPNDILNHQAAREGEKLASIAVEFSHEDFLYEARRNYRIDAPDSQRRVVVSKIRLDGSHEAVRSDPNLFLNSVLPEDMSSHFLFDGEHAESLTLTSSKSMIAESIKDILGCTFVSQSLESLEKIQSGYRRRASASNTSAEVKKLQDSVTVLEKKITKWSEQLSSFEKEIEEMEMEKDAAESALSNYADVNQAQKTKKIALNEIERSKKYEKQAQSSQQTWVGQNASYCLAQPLASKVNAFIAEHNSSAAKNTNFSREIILKILELGECVCGTCIESRQELKDNLKSQLETAETDELQKRLSKVSSLASRLNNFATDESLSLFENYVENQKDHFDAVKKAEITLLEVTTALENADVEGIAKLQKTSTSLYRSILDLQQKKGEIALQLRTAEKKYINEKRQLDELNRSSNDGVSHLNNQKLSELVITFLRSKLNEELNSARTIINKFVGEIIEKTARKNFKVRVDQNFVVSLRDEFGNEMAKSEGENQLLGLAFTGALAKFAKVRKNAKSKLLLPGTEAPLVLDAPFGKLDPVYKHSTAEFLPEMASQVVVMVNREQGSKRVLELLQDRIGFQYALVRHNTGPQNDKVSETLEVNGKEVEITLYDSIFDGTAIELI